MKKYQRLIRPLFISLIILLASVTAVPAPRAQGGEVRTTEIDTIMINDKIIPRQEYDNIAMSTQDSILFNWSCRANGGDKNKFLFIVKFYNEIDSSRQTHSLPSHKYKNLPEQNYRLSVRAFDPRGKWTASMMTVKFRVNNKEAAIRKRLDSLEKIQAVKDSVIVELTKIGPVEIDIYSLPTQLALLFALALAIVIIIALVKTSRRRKMKTNEKSFDDLSGLNRTVVDPDNPDDHELIHIYKSEYDSLISEINKLKNEIETLRNEISALNVRGIAMQEQNKELQKKATLLAESKKELEELQKRKDDLFAVIIHDIKNPAALIKSLVELLRSYDLTAVEQQEIMDDILITTAKIVSLSQEVSRILALEGGRLTMEFEFVQLNEIIKSQLHTNKIAGDNKNIELLTATDDALPEVEVDPQKIEEILDNLISNSIKFTQSGGTVKVKSKVVDDTVVIEVCDNGLGLSEEDIRNAFKRGSRLSSKPTHGESSTGLGLWIVKKLVEAHHGRVWVRSSLGEGSTFSFSLPLKQTPGQENEARDKE